MDFDTAPTAPTPVTDFIPTASRSGLRKKAMESIVPISEFQRPTSLASSVLLAPSPSSLDTPRPQTSDLTLFDDLFSPSEVGQSTTVPTASPLPLLEPLVPAISGSKAAVDFCNLMNKLYPLRSSDPVMLIVTLSQSEFFQGDNFDLISLKSITTYRLCYSDRKYLYNPCSDFFDELLCFKA